MRKWLSLLLILSLVTMLTACSGGSTNNKDSDVLAEVGNTKITRAEADVVLDFMLKTLRSAYGMDITATDIIARAKAMALTFMAENTALEQKLDALGVGLTDADRAQIKENAQASYDEAVKTCMEAYGMTEEEAAEVLEEDGFSLVMIEFYARREMVDAKLREATPLNVQVTDEDVVTRFDEAVEEAMQKYTASPGEYSRDALELEYVPYRPEGYRNIQNLLIGFPEDINAQLDEKRAEAYDISYGQAMLQNDLYTYQDQMTDDEIATYTAKLEELDADMVRVMGEIDALATQGQEQIRAKAEEVLALCQAPGASFEALMTEYSVDPVIGTPLATVGYPVGAESETYVPTFTEAAMALQSVGDISGLVPTAYGWHILKYASDIKPGPVPLDEVREAITSELMAEKEEEAYNAKVDQYLLDANIKTYPDKF